MRFLTQSKDCFSKKLCPLNPIELIEHTYYADFLAFLQEILDHCAASAGSENKGKLK